MAFKVIIKNVPDVLGSVWLATAILSYQKYYYMEEVNTLNENSFAFTQKEIQELANEICTKNVQNARISQWCNADHPNRSYNYLRAVGKKRRLTIPRECNGEREMPDNLLNNSIIIFKIEEGENINFQQLMNWVKETYPTLMKPKEISKEYRTLSKTKSMQRSNPPEKPLIPPAKEFINSLSIDFPKLVVQSSFWVKKEIFDFVTKNNGVDAPGVFYPLTIRKQGAELQGSSPQWKEISDGKRFLDLNHKPQNALSYALVGKSFQAAFRGYTCCHIYGGGKYTHDWKSFTCLGNVVLVPRSLQSLTDHDEKVVDILKQISYIKYGWKPESYTLEISEKAYELEKLAREVGPSLNLFEDIMNREIEKHRDSYRELFKEEL